MDTAFLLIFSFFDWLHRLGGLGLIPLGIADSSVVPLPGSMDVLTVILVSSTPQRWAYYGLMGTVGAVVGGYLMDSLAEKGGEETLEKKFGKKRAKKLYEKFRRHGFAAVAIGGVMPPPFPIATVLMVPGVMKYPKRLFLAALTLGRGVRFFAVAYLASKWGQGLIGLFSRYKQPATIALIVLAGIAALAALIYFKYYHNRRSETAALDG